MEEDVLRTVSLFFLIRSNKSCSQDNVVPTKCSPFWNSGLQQPTNKIDYFSYFKVFSVTVIPQQHGWIFFQTRTQLVYIIAALTASEKESDESSQEPFRCGVGNLFMYCQKLIQYPTVCYTEQISNGSGENSSASDALSLFPKREGKKKKMIEPSLIVHRGDIWCIAGRNMAQS